MRDSAIENVLGQLYKKSLALHRTPLDQLQRDNDNSEDIQQLLQDITRSTQVQIGYPYKDKEFIKDKDRTDKHSRYRYLPWRGIIYVKPAWLKAVYTPRKQNYPLNYMGQEDGNELGDYSKLYLVLDPNADIKKADLKDLSKMISSLLIKSGNPKKSFKDRNQIKRRYKGFVVQDVRRRIRDSNEKYLEKNSKERDYVAKRPRAEYGGVGGRTPIPYIRHRGDIFERE